MPTRAQNLAVDSAGATTRAPNLVVDSKKLDSANFVADSATQNLKKTFCFVLSI